MTSSEHFPTALVDSSGKSGPDMCKEESAQLQGMQECRWCLDNRPHCGSKRNANSGEQVLEKACYKRWKESRHGELDAHQERNA